MSRNEIKVDRLEIRLKGGDPNAGRELGTSIGEEVLQQIANQAGVARGKRSIRIAQIDAGALRLESDPNAPGARRAIAKQIAARVSSRIAPGSTGRNR